MPVADEAEVRLLGRGFSAPPLVVGDKLLLNIGEPGATFNNFDGKLIWSPAVADVQIQRLGSNSLYNRLPLLLSKSVDLLS